MVFIALKQPTRPELFHPDIDECTLCSPYPRLLYLVQPIDCNVRLSNIKIPSLWFNVKFAGFKVLFIIVNGFSSWSIMEEDKGIQF